MYLGMAPTRDVATRCLRGVHTCCWWCIRATVHGTLPTWARSLLCVCRGTCASPLTSRYYPPSLLPGNGSQSRHDHAICIRHTNPPLLAPPSLMAPPRLTRWFAVCVLYGPVVSNSTRHLFLPGTGPGMYLCVHGRELRLLFRDVHPSFVPGHGS